MDNNWNIFICHASEDKTTVADKLFFKLKKLFSEEIWYDDNSILIGDETDNKVFEGLLRTKYGIIILSNNFFTKLYPHFEVGAFILRKYQKLTELIPLYYGISEKELKEKSPILGKYRGISVDNNNIDYVAKKVYERINKYEEEFNKGNEVKEENKNDDEKLIQVQNFVDDLIKQVEHLPEEKQEKEIIKILKEKYDIEYIPTIESSADFADAIVLYKAYRKRGLCDRGILDKCDSIPIVNEIRTCNGIAR
jgi:hypothetical protein